MLRFDEAKKLPHRISTFTQRQAIVPVNILEEATLAPPTPNTETERKKGTEKPLLITLLSLMFCQLEEKKKGLRSLGKQGRV